MKDIDIFAKLKLFQDTLSVVNSLKEKGNKEEARHLQELWMLTRQLGAEVKHLRKENESIVRKEREECAKLVEEMGIDGYGTIAIGLAIRERK